MSNPTVTLNPKNSTIPNSAEGIKAIIELARQSSTMSLCEIPSEILGEGNPTKVPVMLDPRPNGQGLVDIKRILETYRETPARCKGTAQVNNLQSFIDLVKRHADQNASAIFAECLDPTRLRMTCVLNYNNKQKPRWGDHRIVYDFPLTEELRAWLSTNRQPMEQESFARFLEDHAAELSLPTEAERAEYEMLFKERLASPMELVSLSRSLEIHVGSSVKRQERLQTGERVIEFSETHLNSAGDKVDIPGAFIVSVPAFMDGKPVRIPARLRYRISGGGINWFYQLYRSEFWLRDRVKADLNIAATETGLPAFEGTPE